MNFTYKCKECECEIDGDVDPGHDAPACLNHDDPRFSDPGSPANWDGPEECPECGVKLDVDSILEAAAEEASNGGDYGGPDTVEESNE